MKTKNILFAFLTAVFVLGALAINAQTKVYVYKSDGSTIEYNISDVDSISFTPPTTPVDYTKIKLNEVSGVGDDPDKFYELINTGEVDVNLEGVEIYYNAGANNVGDPLPEGIGTLTWTGKNTHIIKAGELLLLLGRYNINTNPGGEFSRGLTPERKLLITMKDPDGNIIDRCLRSEDEGEYELGRFFSFSRIPDGTGPFYFTTPPTPNAMNGTDAAGLIMLPEPAMDYTKLKINEVNGVGKWFEIYNTGNVEINLDGVTAYYSNKEPEVYNLTWTGTSTQTIPANGWFSTQGITLLTGLSANNVDVRLQLRAPDGTPLDTYEKPKDINDGYPEIKNKAHARIPDGTGAWYYTTNDAGTPGATNGTSAQGYTKFGNEDGSPDYSKIRLNEISGVGSDPAKFYEFFNTGTVAVNLEGCKLYYNNAPATDASDGSLTWTGTSTHVIDGNALLALIGRNAPGSFSAGLTAQRNIKITFRDPDGNLIDQFERSDDENGISDKSFSRVPNGSGDFYYTTPSPGELNPTSTEGLTKVE